MHWLFACWLYYQVFITPLVAIAFLPFFALFTHSVDDAEFEMKCAALKDYWIKSRQEFQTIVGVDDADFEMKCAALKDNWIKSRQEFLTIVGVDEADARESTLISWSAYAFAMWMSVVSFDIWMETRLTISYQAMCCVARWLIMLEFYVMMQIDNPHHDEVANEPPNDGLAAG